MKCVALDWRKVMVGDVFQGERKFAAAVHAKRQRVESFRGLGRRSAAP